MQEAKKKEETAIRASLFCDDEKGEEDEETEPVVSTIHKDLGARVRVLREIGGLDFFFWGEDLGIKDEERERDGVYMEKARRCSVLLRCFLFKGRRCWFLGLHACIRVYILSLFTTYNARESIMIKQYSH